MNVKLMDHPNQEMVCVDNNGKETGQIINRKTAHMTPGIKHFAIQVLVFNTNNELILHERPAKKVGGDVLDVPTTHVLNGETPEQAARRCLKVEYNIEEKLPIKILDGFSYEKDYGDGTCENEFCLSAFTSYNGEVKPNAEHVNKIVIKPASQVIEEFDSKPELYPVWFKEVVAIVLKDEEGKKFFE